MNNQLFIQQLSYISYDYKRLCGTKKIRLIYIWLSRAFIGILVYRLECTLFLLFGKAYTVFRIFLLPVLVPLYIFSNIEIHYKANVGAGLSISHPAIGVVISAFSVIGKNLTLTGGNVIGAKNKIKNNQKIFIGDNCYLGANAVILGPLFLGNNIKIGCQSLVNQSFPDNVTLVGIPAKIIKE